MILQLLHSYHNPPEASFDHLPDTIYTEFSEVRNEIVRRTTELAGSDKKIVNCFPINVPLLGILLSNNFSLNQFLYFKPLNLVFFKSIFIKIFLIHDNF